MRVLCTGAAGCIGSHVAERLLADGHEVMGIDNLLTGRDSNFPRDMERARMTICDIAAMTATFRWFRPEVVVHAAASYNDPTMVERDEKTNADGSRLVAELSKDCGVERVVYFQTSLCYGLRPPQHPMREDQPVEPEGSYAVSKTRGETYLLDSGLDVVSFRLANIYGPRNLSGPVPSFYKRLRARQACTVVRSRRDFVFVEDAVEVFAAAVEGRGERGVYHVSTGRDYPIEELYDEVASALLLDYFEPTLVDRGDDDVATILLDPAKVGFVFGWAATTPLRDGIRRAVTWYDEHGVTDTFTHLSLKS